MRHIMLTLVPVLFLQAQELSLKDALQAALQSQPRLKAQECLNQAEEAKVRQAAWARVGKLESALLLTPKQKALHFETPPIGDFVPSMSFEIRQVEKYALQLAYTQPLWTWGALKGQEASARAGAKASRENLTRVRQQTLLETSLAYLQALQAVEAVQVAQQNLDQQKSFLGVAQARVRAGAAARLDQLKAELGLAQAESQLLESRNREHLAREVLVHQTLDSRFRNASLSYSNLEPDPLPDEKTAVEKALGLRSDLAALRSQAKGLNLGAEAVKAAALPALSFRASITQQHEQSDRVFRNSSQLYQIGLALSWDATDPWRSKAKAAELKANERALLHQLRALEEGVSLEVHSQRLMVEEALNRLKVHQRAVDVAEEQARIARIAYREGVGTSLETQEAELALTAARYARLKARLDAAIAQVQLRHAMGEELR